MSNGFTGVILRIDLSDGMVKKHLIKEEFYRKFMGGSAIGTYFLLKETSAKTDPLSAENIITIAPGVTTGAAVSGVSRCCVTALSPETGCVGDSQAGGSLGPMIKKAGYDAIVITGKAKKLSYILIDNEDVQIIEESELKSKTVLEVHDMLTRKFNNGKISILQCGPAGEKLVKFACLMSDLYDVAGRCGMGAVFGSKNLRAVVVKGSNKVSFADPEGIKNLAKNAVKRLPDSGFPFTLSKYGTPGVVGFQSEAGNLSTHNFSKSYHPDYDKLNGENFEPVIGAGHTTCFACAVGCRKKVKAESPYQVTNRLGGPEFETIGLLGTNLDIVDPVSVAKANELCNNYGIDTITMGSLAAYFFESMEKGLIKPELADGRRLGFGDIDGLLWLIEQVCQRQGVGDILAEGFNAAIEKFGCETEAYAINVKGHGLAAHMAQVKPSQALMYAVCPIGADHMSCEHDWLLASNSEACKGLGITTDNPETALQSTGLDKIRMVVYSQYYYSLMDTLCLCMFCWGPGNLFNYKELGDLLSFTTGWDCTFWELMKVGERRVNMMRQLNAKRGFTRSQDYLPKRLNEPLPDGPAKGRKVDPVFFEEMLKNYYKMMDWNLETGNPTEGKLIELGLEWTL